MKTSETNANHEWMKMSGAVERGVVTNAMAQVHQLHPSKHAAAAYRNEKCNTISCSPGIIERIEDTGTNVTNQIIVVTAPYHRHHLCSSDIAPCYVSWSLGLLLCLAARCSRCHTLHFLIYVYEYDGIQRTALSYVRTNSIILFIGIFLFRQLADTPLSRPLPHRLW